MVLERRGRQRLAGGRSMVEEGFFYFVFFVDFLIFEAIYRLGWNMVAMLFEFYDDMLRRMEYMARNHSQKHQVC